MKRSVIILVLGLFLIIGGSFALFTDQKVNNVLGGKFNKFAIETKIDGKDNVTLDELYLPGDKLTFDLTVKSLKDATVGADAKVRHKVTLVSDVDGSEELITATLAGAKVDGKYTDEYEVKVGATETKALVLTLSDEIKNEYMDTAFSIKIETQAVQAKNSDDFEWTTVETSTISFE